MNLYDRAEREIQLIEQDESLTESQKREEIREIERELREIEREESRYE